ncbi:MAG: hypothetical protein Q8N44_10120 [Rubrivivax sp.]|nr:hypothetical protein [Rubrivivax sp.]
MPIILIAMVPRHADQEARGDGRVQPALGLGKTGHHDVELRRCRDEHGAHLRVVARQGGAPFFGGQQSKRARQGQVVASPLARKHPLLPLDDTLAQRTVCKHRGGVGMAKQPLHVGIVPRIAIGCGLVRGAMVLGVQDGCLLPEGARQFQRGHLAPPIREGCGEVIDDPGSHRVLRGGPLVGEGAQF